MTIDNVRTIVFQLDPIDSDCLQLVPIYSNSLQWIAIDLLNLMIMNT
jgi:hypothetical protein